MLRSVVCVSFPEVGSMTDIRTVTFETGTVRPLASPGKRLVARLLDLAVVTFLTLTAAAVVMWDILRRHTAATITEHTSSDTAAWMAAVTLLILIAVDLVYEVALVAVRGQTLGKMAMGIAVARVDTGGVPGWGKALGRWAVPSLVVLIPAVGELVTIVVYMSLVWDTHFQGWHDKAVDTVVIVGRPETST